MRPYRVDSMIRCYQILCFSNARLIVKSSIGRNEIFVNVEQPSCQVFYLLFTW